MNYVLPFYWPTKSIVIDDNKYFLAALKEDLQKECRAEYTFEVRKSLKVLKHQNYNLSWFVRSQPRSFFESNKYVVDYEKIKDIAFDEERFNIYSTLVIDHDMPEMNGFDFCKELSNSSDIRSIMLTGRLDYKEGTNHLNNKIVNSFLSKRDFEISQLADLMKSEERRFFEYYAKPIIDSLFKHNPAHPIFSEVFKDIFDKIAIKHKVCEYYLLNEEGCFLLLDKKGDKKHLFIFSDEELDEMNSEARGLFLDRTLCDKLEYRSCGLCYYNQSKEWPEPEEWSRYMHWLDHRFSIGEKKYYIAIVS